MHISPVIWLLFLALTLGQKPAKHQLLNVGSKPVLGVIEKSDSALSMYRYNTTTIHGKYIFVDFELAA